MGGITLYFIIFAASCISLAVASKILVEALEKMALFMRVREFIVSFFVMAFGVSIPNLATGVIAAFMGRPEISFGDIVGGNIIDLSLALGLAVIFSREGVPADSRTVQNSALATIFFAILPMMLMADGELSRMDGLIMILIYGAYTAWIFSKKERFTRPYEAHEKKPSMKIFTKALFNALFGVVFLILGGWGMVVSAENFSTAFGMELALIGVFVVALGNCTPETFFSIQAARSGQDWMILGDLMGGIIFCAAFVLGIVAMIHPIPVATVSATLIARVFMILVCLFFLVSVRSDRKISKTEGLILILTYVAFLTAEIVLGDYVRFLFK